MPKANSPEKKHSIRLTPDEYEVIQAARNNKKVDKTLHVGAEEDRKAANEAYWNDQYKRLKKDYSALVPKVAAIDRLVANVIEMAPLSYDPAPNNYPKLSAKAHKATPESAVLLLSDTHVGKIIRPEQTLGFSSYNFEVFLSRLKYLEERTISILKNHSTAPIAELVVAMLGDMLDGALSHGTEAGQVNTMFDQFYSAGHAIAQFLRNLATIVPKIRVHTCVGNHCVDTKTEILTNKGWLRYDEVTTNHLCMGLLPNGEAQWQPVLEVVTEKALDRLVTIKNREFDFRGTEHHRFYYWVPGHPMLNEARWSEIESLPIIVPASATVQRPNLDSLDNLIELSGAVLTDGSIDKTGRVIVFQKESNEAWVKVAFEKSGLTFSRRVRTRQMPAEIAGRKVVKTGLSVEVSYALSAQASRHFLAVTGLQKGKLPDFIFGLSTPQFERFLRALLDGDGTGEETTSPVLYGKTSKFLGEVQAVCAMHGWRGSVSPYHSSGKTHYRLNLNKTRGINVGNSAQITTEEATGETVWCVRTETENFFCRRGGKSYFTGNTRWQNQKKMPAENRYSNFDQLLYAYIQALTSNIAIEWHLDEQPFAIFQVEGFTFLAAHGDHWKGGDKAMGVPLHAMARQVNSTTQLFHKHGQNVPQYYVSGHLHREIKLPTGIGDITVNGGFPGLDSYALDGSFNPVDPTQALFKVHPKYGKTAQYSIQLKFAPPRMTPPYGLPNVFTCK